MPLRLALRPALATVFLAVVTVALVLPTTTAAPAAPAVSTLPPVRHVFVIVLENESARASFGDPAADPYLARTLRSEGAYLENYYATGHESNDNYVAMLSGQAPNPQNQADCQLYDRFLGVGPVVSGTGSLLDGQAVGTGCVFPASVPDLANQLTEDGDSWKGYMEDMGNVPGRESPVCGHPALDSQDQTQTAVAGDGYVSRHDPFVYFQGITGDPSYCDSHVVPLGSPSGAMPAAAPRGTTGLAQDLERTSTTPNLSFIVPDVCDDGHDYPCTNEPTPAGSAVGDIDTFLSTWVPLITRSPAFERDGLLVVTFDEAAGPPNGDSTACCGEMPGPNSPMPGITGPGGGKVGALVLSPFVAPGTVSSTPYDHYALLASIEDLFGLPRIGFAADVPATFGSDVYDRW